MNPQTEPCLAGNQGLVFNWSIQRYGNRPTYTRLCVHGFGSYLPPANEVCEGYVFTGVCLSTRVGVYAPLHAGINPLGRHPPVQCMLAYGQQAGSTHFTGMHSCCSCGGPACIAFEGQCMGDQEHNFLFSLTTVAPVTEKDKHQVLFGVLRRTSYLLLQYIHYKLPLIVL